MIEMGSVLFYKTCQMFRILYIKYPVYFNIFEKLPFLEYSNIEFDESIFPVRNYDQTVCHKNNVLGSCCHQFLLSWYTFFIISFTVESRPIIPYIIIFKYHPVYLKIYRLLYILRFSKDGIVVTNSVWNL